MDRTEIRDLAEKARTDLSVARGAFRKLAVANGYKGQAGGWIYHRDRTYASIVQGWQGLADLVSRNPGMFAVTLEREEQDQRAAEAPKVKPLTPAMQRAVDILARDGYVDTIDGVTVGTIVALMKRGVLREATPLGHGLSAGRNYPATTPEQVWDDAHTEQACREMDEAAAEQATPRYRRFVEAIRVSGSYRSGLDALHAEAMEQAAERFYADWDAALVEDDEHSGGWGQPDGMLSTEREQSTPAPEGDDQCGCLRNPLGHSRTEHPTDAPAPTLADDVAALRAGIEDAYTPLSAMGLLASLDRIAGAVPQRATDPKSGAYLYQHDCGHIDGHGAVPTYCYGCSTRGIGDWGALYVLPGDA